MALPWLDSRGVAFLVAWGALFRYSQLNCDFQTSVGKQALERVATYNMAPGRNGSEIRRV